MTNKDTGILLVGHGSRIPYNKNIIKKDKRKIPRNNARLQHRNRIHGISRTKHTNSI
ncbi:hypothetical protein [Methanosphaera stadtmanae]|uniref:hypothetical protein n=1 Tax=Methanosphaera stadtmanae TaxID=2317 RepID=UPI0026DA965A|nr:hypothetical protein [Methanosphaera stadtmanae]